jgi:hypothetical protein
VNDGCLDSEKDVGSEMLNFVTQAHLLWLLFVCLCDEKEVFVMLLSGVEESERPVYLAASVTQRHLCCDSRFSCCVCAFTVRTPTFGTLTFHVKHLLLEENTRKHVSLWEDQRYHPAV